MPPETRWLCEVAWRGIRPDHKVYDSQGCVLQRETANKVATEMRVVPGRWGLLFMRLIVLARRSSLVASKAPAGSTNLIPSKPGI